LRDFTMTRGALQVETRVRDISTSGNDRHREAKRCAECFEAFRPTLYGHRIDCFHRLAPGCHARPSARRQIAGIFELP